MCFQSLDIDIDVDVDVGGGISFQPRAQNRNGGKKREGPQGKCRELRRH